jgi:Predicted oxidoreductases of the aldo/keto reductase family
MLKCESDRDWLFNEQLRKTGAQYFDYYWLHDVNSQTVKTFDELHCWDFLTEKKDAGLVKHIGFSYHDGPELLEKILTKHPEIEYVQIQLNYLDWDSIGIQSRRCYEVATSHNKPVIVMEPVKGGTLAKIPEEAEKLLNSLNPEMSVPSWAIRFAASKENVFMVLSGMSNMEQLIDNTSYMKDFVPLSDAEEKAVFNVADIINRKIAIPCTGCSYCTVNCPKNISIPKFFSLYNTEMLEDSSKNWTPQGGYYERLTIDFGKASDCVGCGQCEGMCPQHLPIRKYLKMVAEKFE